MYDIHNKNKKIGAKMKRTTKQVGLKLVKKAS